jgi:hypothetical protein
MEGKLGLANANGLAAPVPPVVEKGLGCELLKPSVVAVGAPPRPIPVVPAVP